MESFMQFVTSKNSIKTIIYLSIYLFIHLFIYQLIYLFIYLFKLIIIINYSLYNLSSKEYKKIKIKLYETKGHFTSIKIKYYNKKLIVYS